MIDSLHGGGKEGHKQTTAPGVVGLKKVKREKLVTVLGISENLERCISFCNAEESRYCCGRAFF